MPALSRWLLLEGIILRTRPKKSAHAYASIWTKDGSPLILTSQSVRNQLAAELGSATPVYLAMRYGQPSIASVIAQMLRDGITDILLFPQYPHYAMSSWETVVVKVYEEAARQSPSLRVSSIQPFFADADYIEALHTVTAPYLQKPHDHLLFSYHGIPERHLAKSDPTGCHCLKVENCCEVASPALTKCYRAQCFATTREFIKLAGVPPEKYSVSFQSRLGKDPWLKPYTDYELPRLAIEGKKRMLVICPAFVSDCLETIEEIGMRGYEEFAAGGGKDFTRIPCMNEHPAWIEALEKMAGKFLKAE
jgi:ferrochelatase